MRLLGGVKNLKDMQVSGLEQEVTTILVESLVMISAVSKTSLNSNLPFQEPYNLQPAAP